MKLLLLAENWPPRVGGIENYLTNIVRYLNEASITVVVPKSAKSKSTERVEVIKRRFFWPLVKPAWGPLYRWIKKRAGVQPHEVTLCGKALFEGLVGYRLKKKYSIPYVVFTYAMEIETWARNKKNSRRLSRALWDANRVVYINDVTKKTLLAMGVQEKQLVKIWPGVENRFFKEIKENQVDKIREKYEINERYILTTARLIKRKGVDVLIEAFSMIDQVKFEDVNLVIVGDGPESKALKEQAKKMWVNKSVIFLGQVSDAELPMLYTGAEAFIMTPYKVDDDMEGFGIVYLEAAACGTPSIATRSGGAQEAVVNKKTGLVVKPNSLEETKNAIEQILEKNDFRLMLGKNARKRAWQEFRWAKRIELVKEMLDEVLEEQQAVDTTTLKK
jgi:phosphatidylinositol alpha-1,6-mannosyltransferase